MLFTFVLLFPAVSPHASTAKLVLAFSVIQEFSGFENTTFLALFATQAHPVGLLSS